MNSSLQPPTLDSLADQLASLHERMNRQQREIDDLRRENIRLRARALETPDLETSQPAERATGPAVVPPTCTDDERMSRRSVLRRAASVAAGAVAAGVVLDQQSQEANASHSNEAINADSVTAHYLLVTSDSGSDAIVAVADTASEDYAGVWGENNGSGPGIIGQSDAGVGVIGDGLIGVRGQSSSPGYGANYGLHTDNGYGVVGDGHGASTSGVLGRNPAGEGVRGDGRIGVRGTSTTANGYGGQFEGGKAQLRLLPGTTAGKPTTGTHSKGELFLDKNATLWVCSGAGTPGTWRKVSTVVG